MRDAIIFIPGLAQPNAGGMTVDGASRRIAASLDRNDCEGEATYILLEGRDEDYGRKRKARIITIARKSGSVEMPVVDIYSLDYAEPLTSQYRKRLPIVQVASVTG